MAQGVPERVFWAFPPSPPSPQSLLNLTPPSRSDDSLCCLCSLRFCASVRRARTCVFVRCLMCVVVRHVVRSPLVLLYFVLFLLQFIYLPSCSSRLLVVVLSAEESPGVGSYVVGTVAPGFHSPLPASCLRYKMSGED